MKEVTGCRLHIIIDPKRFLLFLITTKPQKRLVASFKTTWKERSQCGGLGLGMVESHSFTQGSLSHPKESQGQFLLGRDCGK
jgi:hypothetical protein